MALHNIGLKKTTPEVGDFRFNSIDIQMETYDGKQWNKSISEPRDFPNVSIHLNTKNDAFEELNNILDQFSIEQLQQLYSNKNQILLKIEQLILLKS